MDNLAKFYSTVKRVNYLLINVACVMLAVLALAVTADVIMRYVFNDPLTGVKQISEYALVGFCFLSVGWVLITRQHVAITLLEGMAFRRSKTKKKKLRLVIDFVCLFYVLPLLWLSVKEVWGEFWENIVLTGELGGAPAYLAHFCIPLGFLSLSIVLILNITANIMGIEDLESGLKKE